MKNLKKWMAAAGVSLTVLTATAAALPAAAATTAADNVAVSVQRGGPVGGASDEYLAQALGITADEIEAAKQTAYQTAVDQALAQGLITQAQADAIKEQAGTAGRLSSRYLRSFTGSDDSAIDLDALLADALGVTTDALSAARTEAQSLAVAAAVEAGTITQEQADQMQAEQALKTYLDEQGFQTQVQTLYENLVKQAVQAGVITQAQADTILSSSNGVGGLHGFDGFGGPGGRGGHGPDGMRGLGAPNATQSDAAPTGAGL